MYRANSVTGCADLLTKEMKVFINQGPECDSNAPNYQYYSWPAEADLTALCTHKAEFSMKKTVVDRCTALTTNTNLMNAKTSCDAEQEDSASAC
jgi:hypothetical protein